MVVKTTNCSSPHEGTCPLNSTASPSHRSESCAAACPVCSWTERRSFRADTTIFAACGSSRWHDGCICTRGGDMSFGLYLIGYIVLIIGLALGAYLIHVPGNWIGIGIIVMVG